MVEVHRMMEVKNNVGKWKESLKRRAEVALIGGDKNDDVVMGLLMESQKRRIGGGINEKTR